MANWSWMVLLPLLASRWVLAEDFSFDAAAFEKPPLTWGGYLEVRQEHQSLDSDALLAPVSAPSEDRSTGSLELEANYTWGKTRFSGILHSQLQRDDVDDTEQTTLYQAYVAHAYDDQLNLELGKRTLRWGKGYAWSPVAFMERSKDPLDPDLSREGYILATADYIQSPGTELRTLAFTPVILPVGEEVNEDYGTTDTNLAAKLYLLYRNVDIDLLYRGEGSRPQRWGLDFAANLTSNFEVHGEWAHGKQRRPVLVGGTLLTQEETVNNLLLGLRYLTAQDTTYILEYYHNDEGYTVDEMNTFYAFIQDPSTSPGQARSVALAGYTRPQGMRNYLYLRITQKEPFNILYFTPGITLIRNIDDHSYTLSPELAYTRITNLELRLRANLLRGDDESEFGAKVAEHKLEFRLRYFY